MIISSPEISDNMATTNAYYAYLRSAILVQCYNQLYGCIFGCIILIYFPTG